MGIIKVRDCCCFDLKTGVLLIGILCIIGCVANIIVAPIDYNIACSDKTPENNQICSAASVKLGGTIASAVIVFILTILMIYGSQKEFYQLMLPAIILQAISIVMSFIAIWYLIIISFLFSIATGFTFLIFGNAVIALSVYLWIVIYSRSEEIRKLEASSEYV